VDLEKHFENGVVLESKQINVPGYPLAFNPSMIRYDGRLLMSFRVIPNRKDNMTSYIGLIWLDEDFNALGEAQILNLRKYSKVKSRAEDARLITIGDKLYVVFSDNRDIRITKGGFRVYVAELDYAGGMFDIDEPQCLSDFEGANSDVREKNWVPFEHNVALDLAYSITPHRIFAPVLNGSGRCDTVAETSSNFSWDLGIVRGGTPAHRVDDEYLAFFHSSTRMASAHSNGKEIMHYFIGAYTFSKDPPFEVARASTSPIVGEGFYSGPEFKGYWKPVRVVFPGGYVFDEQFIWLAYGRDDHELWIAKLDRSKLFESLKVLR